MKVVTRTIEVDKPVVRTVEVPVPIQPHSAQEWAAVLEMLTTRVAQGRIYRRDLPVLEPAIGRLIEVWIRAVNDAH